MAEHPNVGRIRRGYEIRGQSTAFTEQSRAEIEDLFDENMVYYGQGTSRFARDFHGRDQLFSVEGEFAQLAEMRQEVHHIYADDIHAVVLVTVHATAGGEETRWREAEIFHFGPTGKVTETWGIPDDQEVVDAFWTRAMGGAPG